MASVNKVDDLSSFDVPETTRSSNGPTMYKIILQITPKDITKNGHQVIYWKRYSDIRKLYDVLHRYHIAIYRPGKFPDFPDKSGFMERFNPVIVEERRVATKEFLNFALQRLYLRTHDAYLKFFEKGEQVFLPEVQAATLQPQSIILQDVEKSVLPVVEPNDDKADDLLLTVDEEERVEEVTQRCAQILDDLSDLQLDQQEQMKEERQQFQTLQHEVDQIANLLSLPLTVNIDDQEA